jgi:hypothetical protein
MAYNANRVLGGLDCYGTHLAKLDIKLYRHIPGHASMIYYPILQYSDTCVYVSWRAS